MLGSSSPTAEGVAVRESVDTHVSRSGITASRSLVALISVALLIGTLVTLPGCFTRAESGSEEAGETTSTPAASDDLPEQTAAVGETIRLAPLEIRVVSAGPATLPPQAPRPEPGMRQVAVRMTVKNTAGQPLAINATPYSVYNTLLEVAGTEYPGALVSGIVQYVQTGAIPPGVELNLRYLFEVPEDAEEGTFVWRPVVTSGQYPVIRVPVTGLAPGSR